MRKSKSNALRGMTIGVLVPSLFFYLGFLAFGSFTQSMSERLRHIEMNKPYVLPVKLSDQTIGTGVLINLEKDISGFLTNAHVCGALTQYADREPNITVGTRIYRGLMIAKTDPKADLCLVFQPFLSLLQGLKPKNQSSYEFGEELLIIGFPLGGPLTPQTGFYIGEIEASFRSLNKDCPGTLVQPDPFSEPVCIVTETLEAMTDITYPGNSGSPVFNSNNELVGIVNSVDTRTHYGNFISGSRIVEFLKDVK